MSTDRVRKGVKEGGQFATTSRSEMTGVSLGVSFGTKPERYERARKEIRRMHQRAIEGLELDWNRTRLHVASAAVDCGEAGAIIEEAFPDAAAFGVSVSRQDGFRRLEVFDAEGVDLLNGLDVMGDRVDVNDPTGSRAAAAKQASEILIPEGEQPDVGRMEGLRGNCGGRIATLRSGNLQRQDGDSGRPNLGDGDLFVAIRIPQRPYQDGEIPHPQPPSLPKAR